MRLLHLLTTLSQGMRWVQHARHVQQCSQSTHTLYVLARPTWIPVYSSARCA